MAGLGHRIETSLRSLVRRLKKAPTPGDTALVSNEAMIKAHQLDPEHVALTSLLDGRRLFSIQGTLEAALTRVEGERDTVLRLPLRDAVGTRHWIRLKILNTASSGSPQVLRRIRAVAIPDGLEFHFRSDRAPDSAEVILEFTLPSGLPVSDFRPFEDLQPVFRELPGVAEMASYLRACMHQRRNQLQILNDLAESLHSARVRDAVSRMRQRRMAVIFQTEPLALLSERLAARRVEMSATILGAACLSAELEAGTLGLDHLTVLLEEAIPYEPQPGVLERFEEILFRTALGVHDETELDSPCEKALSEAARALTQDSALRVLTDLSSQSKAGASAGVVRLLRRDLRDSSVLSDRSQLALRRLLSARGRSLSRGTMAALCLFVEAELGLITAEQVEGLIDSRERPPTTPYTLAAVGGACDFQLRGFRVPAEQVASLVALAEGQALIQVGRDFLTPDEAPPPQAPTCVLAHLPLLENLHTRDLEVLAQTGLPVHACYRATQERQLIWSASPEPEAAFTSRALGRILPATVEELEGRESVLTTWADLRGRISFRYHSRFSGEELLAPPPDLRWTGEIVELPPPGTVPPVLCEMGRQELSTLEDPQLFPECLSELQIALEGLRDEAMSSLHDHPRLLSQIRLGLVSAAFIRLTSDTIEGEARREILEAARHPDGVREELLAHPALLAMLDMAETSETGLLAAGTALAPPLEARALAARLLPILRTHAASSQTTVRWVVARLLGTTLGALAPEESQDILGELRADRSRGVSSAASASLVTLALAPVRPVPHLLEVRTRRADRHTQRAEESARLSAQVTDHVRGFLIFPQDRSPGARFLVRDDPPRPRPYRDRIEALCALVAGLNLALQADPRPCLLEVRPALAGSEDLRFPLVAGNAAGPWPVSGDGAGMADRTHFSPFFEHLCQVADHLPLDEVEILRHCQDEAFEIQAYDQGRMEFDSGDSRMAIPEGPEVLREAAQRLVQRLGLAREMEEAVIRLLTMQWRTLRPDPRR